MPSRYISPCHCAASASPRTGGTLQVDFIWINRDQKYFEWFVSLLTRLEMDQADEEPEGKRQAGSENPAGCGCCIAPALTITNAP